MTQHFTVFLRLGWRFLAVLALIGGICAAGEAIAAAPRPELYQATVPVSDRSEASQNLAFQAALRDVLVRVTGHRIADADPALAPLMSEARRYVQQFHPAPDGQLAVSFDGAAIERWLAQNSQPIWGRERPSTIVLLAVQNAALTGGSVMTREDTSDLKSLLDAAGAARGIALIWPSAADLQSNRLDYTAVGNTPASALAQIARRIGGEGVLIGHATNATAAATVRWTHVFQDRSSEFSGTADGLDRVADTYAGLFAATGAVVAVDIEVTGVDELRDYATVQAYLESLTFISQISVQDLGPDTVHLRLMTRGGAEPLERAFALKGLLEPLGATDSGMRRFHLHH
jgi:hypothetical protein